MVQGALMANLVDQAGRYHVIYSAAGVVTTGIWQHVALTYDKSLWLRAVVWSMARL